MKMGKLKHTWYQVQNQKCTVTKQTDTVMVENSTPKGSEATANTGILDLDSSLMIIVLSDFLCQTLFHNQPKR